MSLAFRDATADDRTFVIESWVASYRCAHAAGLINMDDWHDVMVKQVAKILGRPGCRTIVAYNPNEDDKRIDLHGWICFEHDYLFPTKTKSESGRYEDALVPTAIPLVHYVFVKQNYRRPLGIARRLFGAAEIDPLEKFHYTCRTSVVSRLSMKIPKARWQPLIARFTKDNPERSEDQNAKTDSSRHSEVSPPRDRRRRALGSDKHQASREQPAE